MRLLLLADSPTIPTSYGNAGRNFAHAVAGRGVTVGFGAMQLVGDPTTFHHRGRTYPVFGCNPPHRIGAAVEAFDPDLIVHVREPLVHVPRLYVNQWYSVRKQASNGAPTWWWGPVQEELVPWDYVEALHSEYSVLMPFTAAGGHRLGNAGVVRDRIAPLPVGVSDSYSDPYGPVARDYGRGPPILMSVGLGHQDRKSFPVLLWALRELAGNPDMEVYLHTTRQGAFDLDEHARLLGVDGKVMWPHLHDPGVGIPEEALAARYRRAWAYVSVGTGEGWDMPLSEACALGRVAILPRDSNRLEVVDDYAGPKIVVRSSPLPRPTGWERIMDPDDLARQIRRHSALQPDPEAGRDYYRRHSWDAVADRFVRIARERGVL